MATAAEEEEDRDWLPTIKSQRVVNLLDTAQYSTVAERSAVILVLGERVAGKARFIQQLTRSEEIHISEDGQSGKVITRRNGKRSLYMGLLIC